MQACFFAFPGDNLYLFSFSTDSINLDNGRFEVIVKFFVLKVMDAISFLLLGSIFVTPIEFNSRRCSFVQPLRWTWRVDSQGGIAKCQSAWLNWLIKESTHDQTGIEAPRYSMPTMSEFFFIPFFLKKANAFDNIQIKSVLSIFISPDEDRNRNEFSVWIKKRW